MSLLFDVMGDFYSFHRPFYERQGFCVKNVENGAIVLLNALGVNKEDINVNVSEGDRYNVISVSGLTKDEELNETYDIKIDFKVVKKMKEITWDVQNGFMKLWITFDKPKESSVTVTRK